MKGNHIESKEWTRPEAQPKFDKAGRFEAWVGAAAPNGRSAVAWKIRNCEQPNEVHEHVAVSSSDCSTNNRSECAGALGALEDLPNNSEVTIYCQLKYVVDCLNGDLVKWRNRGWKDAKGKPQPNADIYRRMLDVIRNRNLKVSAVHIKAGNSHHYAEIRRLKARANAHLDKKLPEY